MKYFDRGWVGCPFLQTLQIAGLYEGWPRVGDAWSAETRKIAKEKCEVVPGSLEFLEE
jgi:hypothetical protein